MFASGVRQRPVGAEEEHAMRTILRAVVLALAGSTAAAFAQPVKWTVYSIPESGTSVDFPSSIFERAGDPPDGYGQRFRTPDGRADITIQAAANVAKETPAAFLARRHPPPSMQYKRITSRFFAVSSYKGDTVWYDRCNFSNGFVHCVLINYPAAEEHDWDDVVTRISLSLGGR
jgi:hypothetical protein